MKIDQYLWNDQTLIVAALFPDIEEQWPDINDWYEIKCHPSVFIDLGEVVVQAHGHAWLGNPRNRDIYAYIDKLQSRE